MIDKKVVIISTGGTIAMRYDEKIGGVVPATSGEELVEAVPPLKNICPIEVVEFSNIPSPHMTPHLMLELSKKIEEILKSDEVSGVVVTHGTDTVEETAYFSDLYLCTEKPVCFTAAMRSGGEISADGPANIYDAVRVAASEDACGKGVMVVLNDEIHTAKDVTKTHSGNVATFKSPYWGAIGYVDSDRVIFNRIPIESENIRPDNLEEDVHILKCAAGTDPRLLKFLVDENVKGIVIEALGRGNVPPAIVPEIKRAISKNIPVVITTRVPMGRVLDVYGYEGGAKPLKDMGAILGGELSSQKARLKMMLALGLIEEKKTDKDIKDFF